MPGTKQGALRNPWVHFLCEQGLYVHRLSRSTDLRQKEGTKSTDAEPFQASSAAQGANSSLMDSMLLTSCGAAVPEGQQKKEPRRVPHMRLGRALMPVAVGHQMAHVGRELVDFCGLQVDAGRVPPRSIVVVAAEPVRASL